MQSSHCVCLLVCDDDATVQFNSYFFIIYIYVISIGVEFFTESYVMGSSKSLKAVVLTPIQCSVQTNGPIWAYCLLHFCRKPIEFVSKTDRKPIKFQQYFPCYLDNVSKKCVRIFFA